jgi:Methyltransferase domain
LNYHSIFHQVFKIWRKKRFQLFLQVVKPSASDILLDVGGSPWFWVSQPQAVRQIDTLNVHEMPWDFKAYPNHNIRSLVGDGCSLALPDQGYDIGFSNSVIEHVGSWERQQQFAREIRRVAKVLWVQTPAYECPIEPHYMALFIHYLPRPFQKKIVRWWTPWGWLERPNPRQVEAMVDSTRLLTKSEMQQLFPDCEFMIERMLWIIPKSYIAFRRRI